MQDFFSSSGNEFNKSEFKPFLNKDFKLVKPLTITVKESIIEIYPPQKEIYVYDKNILFKGKVLHFLP